MARGVLLAGVVAFLLFATEQPKLAAQDFRATLQGQVTDSAQAAIVGAQVVLTNNSTGVSSQTSTAQNGNYALRLLPPGEYTLSISHSGFQTVTRKNIVLNVNQVAVINVALPVGSATSQVVVTAAEPLLDAGNADRGQVIDKKKVQELPLVAMNPIVLATLSPGVQYSGNIIYSRPFDNGALAQWNINGGGNNTAEFLLDGAPNEAQAGVNNVALMPPGPSVAEFKVAGPTYNAAYGRSSGAIFDTTLKSGTDQFHGNIYAFGNRTWMNANSFQNKSASPVVARPYHKVDQDGAEVDGPVVIPRLYSASHKTFFMVNYERYHEIVPNAGTISVPEPEFLSGDFSKLTDSQGNLITIYDPLSGHDVGGNWVRDPFPGNIIPSSRINPIAQKILSYFPKPNQTGAGVGYSINNLFLEGPQAEQEVKYHVLVFRIDQAIGAKDRIFFRHGNSRLDQTRPQNGILNGLPGNNAYWPYLRKNEADVIDWAHTLNATTLFDFRASFSRYVEGQQAGQNQGFDPTKLGFPSSLASQIPHGPQFGTYTFGQYTYLGGNYNTTNFTDTASVFPSMIKTLGKHTLTVGADLRWFLYIPQQYGNPFNIGSSKQMTQADYTIGDAHSGNEIASFLIDAPSSISSDNNAAPTFEYTYIAPFVQDDWKVTPRLTLNLGLRWDYNPPPFERHNMLDCGFDQNVVNPVDAMVDRQQFPDVPALKGAILFAGVNGAPRRAANTNWTSIQPRVGFAWLAHKNTVVRGGYGRFYPNPSQDYLQTNGFSQSTSVPTSPDGGKTPYPQLLENPFPQGFPQPPGSSLGALTFLGRGFSYFSSDFKSPYDDQFSVEVEQAMPWQSKFDISYVGSRLRNGQSNLPINNISAELRNQCNALVGGNQSVCNQQVPNPYKGIEAFKGTGLYTQSTESVATLSTAYPEFGGITQLGRNDNKTWYNALQTAFSIQATNHLNLLAAYTFSKQMEESGFLDPILLVHERGLSGLDHTHQFNMAIVHQLPFGQGQYFFSNANPFLRRLVSGWQDSWTVSRLSGRLWGLPGNVIQTGNAHVKPRWNQAVVRGVSPCVATFGNDGVIREQQYSVRAGCGDQYDFLITPNYAPRMTNYYDPHIRLQSAWQANFSLDKTTEITERMRVQLRAEAFNVFNKYWLYNGNFDNNPNDSNFGTLTRSAFGIGTSNQPRQIQLAVELLF